MSAQHVGEILLCQPIFLLLVSCRGIVSPTHLLRVARNGYYTFLGTYHVSHACRNQIFCCKEHFVRSTQHKKLFSRLGAFHAFARSTQYKNCFLVSGRFMSWRFIIVLGAFIKKDNSHPFPIKECLRLHLPVPARQQDSPVFHLPARHPHARSFPLGSGVLGQRLSFSNQHIQVHPPRCSALHRHDRGHSPLHHPACCCCQRIRVHLVRRQFLNVQLFQQFFARQSRVLASPWPHPPKFAANAP